MRAIVESTQTLALVNGQRCRVWEGLTEGGSPLYLFVPFLSIAAPESEEQAVREAMVETSGDVQVQILDALDGV